MNKKILISEERISTIIREAAADVMAAKMERAGKRNKRPLADIIPDENAAPYWKKLEAAKQTGDPNKILAAVKALEAYLEGTGNVEHVNFQDPNHTMVSMYRKPTDGYTTKSAAKDANRRPNTVKSRLNRRYMKPVDGEQ